MFMCLHSSGALAKIRCRPLSLWCVHMMPVLRISIHLMRFIQGQQVQALRQVRLLSLCRSHTLVCGSVSASGACCLPWGVWILLSRALCRAHG